MSQLDLIRSFLVPLQLLSHTEAKEKMVKTVKGWMQNCVHTLVQLTIKNLLLKLICCSGSTTGEFTELVGGRQEARDKQSINHKPDVTCYKKKQPHHWTHRREFSTWDSPSALLGTGKVPPEVPDLVWGPVLQKGHGPLGESPEDTSEHGKRSRNHACKERFRTKNWRKRGNVVP